MEIISIFCSFMNIVNMWRTHAFLWKWHLLMKFLWPNFVLSLDILLCEQEREWKSVNRRVGKYIESRFWTMWLWGREIDHKSFREKEKTKKTNFVVLLIIVSCEWQREWKSVNQRAGKYVESEFWRAWVWWARETTKEAIEHQKGLELPYLYFFVVVSMSRYGTL